MKLLADPFFERELTAYEMGWELLVVDRDQRVVLRDTGYPPVVRVGGIDLHAEGASVEERWGLRNGKLIRLARTEMPVEPTRVRFLTFR